MTYELMEPLKSQYIEADRWFYNIWLMSFLVLLSTLPAIFGAGFTTLDSFVIGLGLPYVYYNYLKYRESYDYCS